ncbi:MAG: Cell division protein FtsK [uncultured Gemmatimonadetes bacterium]|uniref:Cell division protein FtsK n=1 Tax=uncultured Gemmatimonadota bacterium TaxID=203437 RepID=A0A6J4K918_9BACT|nr:MAG: Cell division protein FtsK [uncultured Gemmatimonadota bacterium]
MEILAGVEASRWAAVHSSAALSPRPPLPQAGEGENSSALRLFSARTKLSRPVRAGGLRDFPAAVSTAGIVLAVRIVPHVAMQSIF